MCTAHVYSANILSGTRPKMKKNASSVPKLINGKWPMRLGQKEGQLKKVVAVFPITASKLDINPGGEIYKHLLTYMENLGRKVQF